LDSLGEDRRIILKWVLNINKGDVEGIHPVQDGVKWRVCGNDIDSSGFIKVGEFLH
jgi:hypothetical protein